MLVELDEGLGAASCAPQQKLVVVATRCELLVIEGPLETADFLSMANQLSSVVLRRAQISVQNAVIAAASAQESIIPSHSTNATIMATHSLQQLVLRRIPDLELAGVRADGEQGAVAGPLDTRDAVVGPDVAQLRHLAILGRPEVDAGAEADGQNILCRPVNQVKVKIVLEGWGIEHLEWLLGNHSLLFVLF